MQKKILYFEWSPPWHVGRRLSGGGCHWEYDGKNGDFENTDFRFPWLSDTSEMGFGHDVPFLRWTSQTDSDVLSDISFDILSDISSDISSDILSDISVDILSDISSDSLSGIFLTYLLTFFLAYLPIFFLAFFLTYLLTCFLTYLLTFFLTYQNQNLTSTAWPKKAALQTLYLPHATQQK